MLSTKHVVLGLVIDRPGYGYELQQRIEDRFAFLNFSEAVVYRALDRLEHDGLVAESGPKLVGRTKRGSPRVMYAPTDDGAAEFRRWMKTPSEVALVRDELHVKLVLAEPEDRQELLEQTFELERVCLAELQLLSRPPLHEVVDGDMAWSEVAAVLVDDARATRLQATVEWLQRVRAVLERRPGDR
jgi:DNA-binding PadR family transcriptional regulator